MFDIVYERIYRHILISKTLHADFVYLDPKTFSCNKNKWDTYRRSYVSIENFKDEYDNFIIHYQWNNLMRIPKQAFAISTTEKNDVYDYENEEIDKILKQRQYCNDCIFCSYEIFNQYNLPTNACSL